MQASDRKSKNMLIISRLQLLLNYLKLSILSLFCTETCRFCEFFATLPQVCRLSQIAPNGSESLLSGAKVRIIFGISKLIHSFFTHRKCCDSASILHCTLVVPKETDARVFPIKTLASINSNDIRIVILCYK